MTDWREQLQHADLAPYYRVVTEASAAVVEARNAVVDAAKAWQVDSTFGRPGVRRLSAEVTKLRRAEKAESDARVRLKAAVDGREFDEQ